MKAIFVESTMLVLLGAVVALADERPLTVYDLAEQGAVVIGSGKLLEEYHVTCWPMPRDLGCNPSHAVYGEFRRIKLNGTEFVCISFRQWTCRESR